MTVDSAIQHDLTEIVPVLEADPFALDVLRSPYQFQEMLRETGPVAYLKKYGSYAVGRYDEVRSILKEWESFTSTAGAGLSDIRKPDAWRQPGPIVESDPPAHTHIRAVLTKIISPAITRRWQASFDEEAAAMADRLCEQRDIDGAKDVAEDYVMKVFPESLGLKVHQKNMVIVGDFNFNALGPKNELFERSQAAMAEIADWYATAQQRDGVVPGSFAEQIFLAEDAGELAPGLAQGLVRTFLRGGMDTTISGIASSLMILSQKPDLWRHLREDRSRVKFVFEEVLRLESPIQSYFRTTTKPVEVAGVPLQADTKVQVFIGAANRDPRKWPEPDVFDIQRKSIPHVAFGYGIHVCIGQMIARMEAESVLTALLDRVATIEPRGQPVHRPLNTLRTLDSLPLRLTPA
jgi:4-methoxybenzoate monooxygenase (O-demethylating)